MAQIATAGILLVSAAFGQAPSRVIQGTPGVTDYVAVLDASTPMPPPSTLAPSPAPNEVEGYIARTPEELAAAWALAAQTPPAALAPLASTPLYTAPIVLSQFFATSEAPYINFPADAAGAIGPGHAVVAVNTGVSIHTKDGSQVAQYRPLLNFWSPLNLFTLKDPFDPRVVYDPYGQRFILVALSNRNSQQSTLLLAVSKTSNPIDGWYLWYFPADPTGLTWIDFPSLGFNKDWIVVSNNQAAVGTTSLNGKSKVYVIRKSEAYTGSGTVHYNTFVASFTQALTPASTLDPTLATVYLMDDYDAGNGMIRLSTITGAVGSETLNLGAAMITVPAGGWSLHSANFNDLAPQLGSVYRIDSGDARMQNVVYRNGRIWCAHSILLPNGGTPTRTSVQWLQLDPSGALQQTGRIDDPSGLTFYSYPSIAVNKNDVALIGFATFSAMQYAQGAFGVHTPSDPPGVVTRIIPTQPGSSIIYQVDDNGHNRWGDYTSSVTDAENDTDFWTLQESAGGNYWGVGWTKVWEGDGTIRLLPAISSYDFKDVRLWSTATYTLELANSGNTQVQLALATTTSYFKASSSCDTNLGPIIPALSTCMVTLTFKPTTSGTLIDQLTIYTTGIPSKLIVALSGNGRAGTGWTVGGDDWPGTSFSPTTGGFFSTYNNNVLQPAIATWDTAKDPVPPCDPTFTANSRTVWFNLRTDGSGLFQMSLPSTAAVYSLSVWTRDQRDGWHNVACVAGLISIGQFSLNVIGGQTYYLMVKTESTIQGGFTPAIATVPIYTPDVTYTTPDFAGTSSFRVGPQQTDVHAWAVINSSLYNLQVANSTGQPPITGMFAYFSSETPCVPQLPPGEVCIILVDPEAGVIPPYNVSSTATIHWGWNFHGHSSGGLTVAATISPVFAADVRGERMMTGSPLTDFAYAPATVQQSTTCGSGSISTLTPFDTSGADDYVYEISPAADGTLHASLGNYVLRLSADDDTRTVLGCYSQYGASSDQGFSLQANKNYFLTLRLDARSYPTNSPLSWIVTLTYSGGLNYIFPGALYTRYGTNPSPPILMQAKGLPSDALGGLHIDPSGVTTTAVPCPSNKLPGTDHCFTLQLATLYPATTVLYQPKVIKVIDPLGDLGIVPYGPKVRILPYGAVARAVTPVVSAANVGQASDAAISGPGIKATWAVPPTNLGSQAVGTTSPAWKLYMLMTGEVAPLTVSVTGDFGQSNSCDVVSYQHPFCIVKVTFSPTVSGTRNGTLTVSYVDYSQTTQPVVTNTVSLTGTGVAIPAAALTSIRPPRPSRPASSATEPMTQPSVQRLPVVVLPIGTPDTAGTEAPPADAAATASDAASDSPPPQPKKARKTAKKRKKTTRRER